jgi:hypothetical protein
MDKRRPDGTWVLDRVHPDMEPAAGFASKAKTFALEAPGKPSKWITLAALRVLKRVENVS